MIDVTAPPYGAKGDGVTDDAAAVQAALDQGGHVYFPGGTYRIGGQPLRIREQTRLELAPDATIMRASAAHLIRNRWPDDNFPGYSGRGRILIEGGTWDMQGNAGGDMATAATCLMFAHATDVKIRDTRILNAVGAHGIDMMGCRNVRVTGVTFSGYLASATDTQPRESIQVDGCYGTYSGDCAPVDATACDDVLITGCRFEASKELPAPQRAVGSHGYTADVDGHPWHHNIRVVNNTAVDLTNDAFYAWKWQESSITKNTVYGAAGCGVVLKDGSFDIDVLGNRIFGVGRNGIWADNGAHNFSLIDNRIVGAGASANNTWDGIRLTNNCSTSLITENRVRRSGGPADARYGLYIDGGSKHSHYGNYLLWSGVTAAVKDLSSAPYLNAVDVT